MMEDVLRRGFFPLSFHLPEMNRVAVSETKWAVRIFSFIVSDIFTHFICASPQAERSGCDVNILSIPVPIRRGGSESNLDVVDSVGDDGVGLDFTKGALGIDSLQQKILKVKANTSHLLQNGVYARNTLTL